MSDPLQALHGAVVSALEAHPVMTAAMCGVFDGPAPRVSFPYVSIANGSVSDWSTKTIKGREIILMLTVWDDGEDVARLQNLMQAVEDSVGAIPRDLGGWRVASLVYLRSRIVRNADGPWAGMIDHRVRVLEG
jgi:hypothetical protein